MLFLPLEKALEFEFSSALDSLRGSVRPGGWAWDKDSAGTPVLPGMSPSRGLQDSCHRPQPTHCNSLRHLMRAKGEGTAGVADVPRIPDSREGWMVSPPSHT